MIETPKKPTKSKFTTLVSKLISTKFNCLCRQEHTPKKTKRAAIFFRKSALEVEPTSNIGTTTPVMSGGKMDKLNLALPDKFMTLNRT